MTAIYRITPLALLLAMVLVLGAPRPAHAGDAGRILAGIAAGALVYELLDDDDCCCHTGYACRMHPSRGYRYSRSRYSRPHSYSYSYGGYGPGYGATVVYRDNGCRSGGYSYRARDHYDCPRRAPSHARRSAGPYYRGHGRDYSPPGRYRR